MCTCMCTLYVYVHVYVCVYVYALTAQLAHAHVWCRCGPMVDLCTGPHLPNTGYLRTQAVNNLSRAFWRADVSKDPLQVCYTLGFSHSGAHLLINCRLACIPLHLLHLLLATGAFVIIRCYTDFPWLFAPVASACCSSVHSNHLLHM